MQKTNKNRKDIPQCVVLSILACPLCCSSSNKLQLLLAQKQCIEIANYAKTNSIPVIQLQPSMMQTDVYEGVHGANRVIHGSAERANYITAAHYFIMRRETEEEEQTRVRGDVGTPNSGSNDQSVNLKLAAFVSAASVERIGCESQAPDTGVLHSKALNKCSGGKGSQLQVYALINPTRAWPPSVSRRIPIRNALYYVTFSPV